MTPTGTDSAVLRQPQDLRLAGPAAAAWLVTFVLLGTDASTAAVTALCGALVAVACRVTLRSRPALRSTVPATLACAAAAAACSAGHLAVLDSGPVSRWAAAEREVRAELVVSRDPVVGEISGPSWQRGRTVSVRASLRRVEHAGSVHVGRQPVLVITREHGWRRLTPGQRVVVAGELATPLDEGTLAAVLFADSSPRLVGRPPSVQRVAASLRAGLRDAVSGLPAEERGLIPGLVVGDTSGLSQQLEEEFKRTGLAHLLAVSGANLAIVTGAILVVGRRVSVPPKLLALLAVVGILGFVVLARPEPSVLRAAVMGVIGLVALGLGRPRLGLPALFTAVLVLLYTDPALARSYGFALSVLATFGLLVLAPSWRDRLIVSGCPRLLAEAVSVPAAAQVMCAPVIAMLAGQVSLVAVFANLLAAPAVPPVTVFGVLATAIEPFLPPVAELLAWCAWLPAKWLVLVAWAASAVPVASVSWSAGPVGGVALALLTLVALGAMPYRPVRRAVAAAAAGATIVAGSLHLVAPGWPPKGWQLVACDVGQGDGLVLRAGERSAVIVDAGPDPAAMRRCLDRLRVQRVPLVLVTHLHADHVAGMNGVLDGRTVGAIVTTPLRSPGEQLRDLRASAHEAGVEVSYASAGTRWRLGELTLTVLWPRQRTGSDTYAVSGDSATNDASLVVRAERPGLSVLLTGDIEPPTQERILSSGADLTADVLKVPHHGSSQQDHAFLAATGARIAVISAGVDNDYGHPAERTLRALRARGMRVLRTDRGGDVAVLQSPPRGLAVATRGPAERIDERN